MRTFNELHLNWITLLAISLNTKILIQIKNIFFYIYRTEII